MSRTRVARVQLGTLLLFVATLLAGSASTLHAATVTATWSPDPASEDVAAYLLSYGTQSGTYSTTVNVGNVTTSSLTLTAGQTYYFVVQAVNTTGLTSPYSAEVAFAVPASPTSPPPAAPAQMTTPAPGSTLTASTVTFQWTGGTGVTAYELSVGTAAGAANLFNQNLGTSLSATVTGLPTNGSTVYVQLSSLIGGTWQSNGYTYTAATITTAVPAQMTTPAPGSTLTASAVTFQWTGGTGVTAYELLVGTAAGANNLFDQDLGSSLSATVTGLPSNGSTVYVTLSSLIGGTWQSNAYTYTATTTTSMGPAQMTTPAPGSTLTASTVTFEWTGGTGVSAYWLDVGSTAGGNNFFANGGYGSILSATVTGLPSNGSTVYTTLWSLIGGTWQSNAYSYRATSNTATGPAQMTTPAPGSTLTASTVTFQWTGGTGVTAYELSVGTAAGATNLFNQNLGTSLAATVTGLPTNGSTVYVQLSSLIGGTWQSNGYTYTAAAATSTAVPAQMTAPAPGSTLTASTVTFQWTGGTGVSAYELSVGTTAGATNLFNQNLGTSLSTTVAGLPTDGSTVYVTLSSLISGTWQSRGYTYTATTTTSTGPAQMTTPAPGSTLTASTVTFRWTGGTGVSAYWLDVGSTAGGNDFYANGGYGSILSATVVGLPSNGSTVYVTLWSLIGGSWLSNEYSYTAN